MAAQAPVAKIGSTEFATLAEAFAAAQDKETIEVLADCSGNGIKVPQGKFTTGLTVNFGGHTYTVDGETVGSTGTETNGFQLLKDNKITFTNGAITSSKAKILVQNYSDLTLDGMTLSMSNTGYNEAYTLSNNNGDIVINNSKINANPSGGFAFDVCRYSSYPSVHVTVTGTSEITGNIEVSASGNDAKDGFSLTLKSGTLNGKIVVAPSAAAAIAATPDNAVVSKNDNFNATAPAGYVWTSEGNGNSVLTPAVAKIGSVSYVTLADAFANAQDGETIEVLADCSGNGIKVPQGKFTTGLTVNFGGHTYTVDGETVGSTGTETNGFQLLKDNKITFNNGTLTSSKAKILVQNYSNLTLNGMTLTMSNADYNKAYTLSNNNGDIVINNSEITANTGGGFAFDVCRYSSYPSVHVTVTGTSEINGNIEVSASGNDAKDGFSLMLESGTLDGNIVVDPSAAAAIAATPDNAVVSKNDNFNATAPAGYVWTSEGNGNSVLTPAVAKIGSVSYATLAEAFAAAQDGETIEVLADCSGNGIKVPQGKFTTGLTVNFGGHTYTVDGETVGSTGTETNGFQLLKDNKITFNNGTLTSSKAKILVQNYSNLTLNGMTLTMSNADYNKAYTLSNNNGDIVINNSEITANTGGGFAFDVCRYSSYPSVHVTVTGTSEINGNIEVSASGNDAKDGFSLMLESGTLDGNIVVDPSAAAAIAATPDKAVVREKDTFSAPAPAGYVWTSEGNGNSVLTPAVAKIGSVSYATLAEAFAAAQDGETIEVLADCSGNGIKVPQGKFTTGLTVNFGGHTYTVDGETVGSTGTETNGFQLLKDNKITFTNGAITSAKAKILVQNYSDLTLDGMTLSMSNTGYNEAYTLSNNNGDIVINNSKINANPSGGFAFDVCRYASYPSVNVTVTGTSEINGNIELYASNGDAKDGFSLTLESGKLTGNIVVHSTAAAAIAATPEKVTVREKDTFSAPAPAGYVWTSEGNGNSVLTPAVAKIGSVSYATLADAFAAAQDGATIEVLANCSGNGIKVLQGKFTTGLTVNFGGHTYTVDGETVGSTGTETNGFQLLKDNKITFTNGAITSAKAKILVQNYSNLTLDRMTLSMSNTGYSEAYTLSNNNGNIVINDSEINANPSGGFAFDVCRYSSYPSVNVTVTGTSEINGNIELYASNGDAKDGFSLTLESGKLTGNIVVNPTAAAAIAATPEKVTVREKDTFSATAPAGYVWTSEGNGNSVLTPAVAKIGSVSYATLADAFAAAQDGETIEVLADCSGNGIKVPQGKFTTGLTVNFGGHTYTVDGETVGSTGTETNGFQLLKDNKITFTNGAITSAKAKILVQNYSNLTLDRMTLSMSNTGYSEAYTLSNNNGNIVINDSEINANTGGGFAFDVCRYASYPSVHVTVTGTNSVINGNIEVSASGNDAKDGFSLMLESGTLNGNIVVAPSAAAALAATPDKAVVREKDTFNAPAPEGYAWTSEGEGTDTSILAPAVARINDVNYASLADAVNAAATTGENVTITMLKSVSQQGFVSLPGQNITIDMNGNRVNLSTPAQIVAGSAVSLSGSGMLGIDGNDATVSLLDNYGTLSLDGAQVLGKVTGKAGSTTNLNSGTLYMTLVGESGANVNIGSTASQPRFNAGFGSVTAMSGSTFTITGGDMRNELTVEDGANIAISGGYFKTKILNDWCATGYVPTLRSALTGTSPYSVVKQEDAWAKLVATDGSEYYYTQYLVGTALNNYSSDGDKLVLLKDHSSKSFSINNNKSITLDLNGFNLKALTFWYGTVNVVNGTILGDVDLYAQVENSGKVSNLTIGEGCIADNGVILWPEDDNSTNTGYDATLTVSGTVNNGIFVHGNLQQGNSVINIVDGGIVNDENGVAIAMNGAATVNVQDGATVNGGSTGIEVRAGALNVSGGVITGGDGATTVSSNASGSTTQNAGIAVSQHVTQLPITINVSGGEITATTALYIVNPQNNDSSAGAINLVISGDDTHPNFTGHTTIEDDRADLSISGGFFDDPVRPIDCAEGYAPFGPLANNKYTVGRAVAQITRDGNVLSYITLADAFAAAKDGETIVVLADCAGNGIVVPQGKFTTGLTVDFGDHTYTVDGETVGSTGTETNAFQLLKDNKITFTNGAITSSKAKILVQNYSNLTLDGMKLSMSNESYSGAYTLSNNNGDIVINNSEITANTGGGFAFDVCRYASYPSVHVTVTGTNSVINGNIEVSASGNDAKDGFSLMLESGTLNGNIVVAPSAAAALAATPDKAVVREKDTFNAPAPAGYVWTSEGEGTGTSILAPAVAQITRNETVLSYASLADAVAAAQAHETVVMIANSTETKTSVVNNAITIDLNGKTVTREGTALQVRANLTVTDASTDGGGNIQATSNGAEVYAGATLTVSYVTINADFAPINMQGGSAVVNNSSLSGRFGIFANDANTNSVIVNSGTIVGANPMALEGGSFVLNGGTISPKTDYPVFLNGCEQFTMNGGVVNTYLQVMKPATIEINDGTINSDLYGVFMTQPSAATLTMNGGKINSQSFAIVNNGEATPSQATTITITGGEIHSESTAIYHPGMGDLTITGGTITAGTGIVMRNGKLDISGGTIHASGPAKEPTYEYVFGGSEDNGDAVQIESSNYGNHITKTDGTPAEPFHGETYNGTIARITGGIFISDHAQAIASYVDADDQHLSTASDGTPRRENFIYNGWFSNVIPAGYCAPSVVPDPSPRTDAPDPDAPYTVRRTTLAVIEQTGVVGNVYTVADELVGVHAFGNLLLCKDQGNVSIAKTEPATGAVDYMAEATGTSDEWDQSNWVWLEFPDTEDGKAAALSGVSHVIMPNTITGTYCDDVNYRIRLESAGLIVGAPMDFVPNKYCPANFMSKNWTVNGETQAVAGNKKYYFVNPKVCEYATVTYAVYIGNDTFVIPEKSAGTNEANLDGAFKIVYDSEGGHNLNEADITDVMDALNAKANNNEFEAYKFEAVIGRVNKADFGRAPRHVAPKDGQTASSILVIPTSLAASNIVTGVNELQSGKEVYSVRYYDVSGRMSRTPFEGVNIVVTEYTDGTLSTTKVLK